jgi:hypothetical protein
MKTTTHEYIHALRGLLLILVISAITPYARSQIFVTSTNGFVNNGTVGEYNLNDSVLNADLVTGLYAPGGIATNGSDIFVADRYQGTIGEYSMSGATISPALVSGLGDTSSLALSGSDLFVAENGIGSIGEYTTSGAVVSSNLITGLSSSFGNLSIAIFGSNVFVDNAANGTVSEYTTSGALVNAALIGGLINSDGLVVSGSDIFVDQFPTPTTGVISEYTISGSLQDATLIHVTGFGAEDMSLSGSNLLVVINGNSTYGAGAIGAYGTSGSPINNSFISGLYEPTGVTAFPGGASVPDGGSTVAMFGAAFLGLAMLRRPPAKQEPLQIRLERPPESAGILFGWLSRIILRVDPMHGLYLARARSSRRRVP